MTGRTFTASAGVAPNKFIAKIASDYRKPNGLVVVPPEHVIAFIEKLPVEKIWGVGPATETRLHALGIVTAADIRVRDPLQLEKELGKFGRFIFDLSHGRDDREVESHWEPKSRGTETTFDKDILDAQELIEILESQADEVSADLKRIERQGKTVTVKIRYSDFKTITRSESFIRPTWEAQMISRAATGLLFKNTEVSDRAIRLVGLSVSGFANPNEPEQLWLDLPLY